VIQSIPRAAIRQLPYLAVLALVHCAVLASPAAARVLFGDNFNSADSSDVSAGKEAPNRQLGDLAILDYWEQGVAEIQAASLRLNSLTGAIIPRHDFVDAAITGAGGMVVEFDVNPAVINGDGSQTNWGAVTIGLPQAAAQSASVLAEYSPKAFSIGLRDNGRYFVFGDGNVRIDGAMNPPDDDPVFDTQPRGDEWYHVKLTVFTRSFGVEELATVTVEVSGELDDQPERDARLLVLDDGRDNNGIDTAFRYDWTSGENYISLEAFADGDFDNLRIATPLVGDTNDDGLVNVDDLNNVRNTFGGSGAGDTNGDGVVNVDDLNNVRNTFGASVAEMLPVVPEPSSAVLALLATLALLGGTRR